MFEGVEDFFNHCIIRELQTYYELEFSKDMFPAMPYYTDARTVLAKNGYLLKLQEDGFELVKGGVSVCTYTLGIFSACFLNQWIADSGIEGVSGFPVGFSIVGAKTKQGALARFSNATRALAESLLMTPAQADSKVAALFVSDDISQEREADLYVFKEAKLLSKNDFVEEDEDGRCHVAISEPGKNIPFYHAIDMRRKGKAPDVLPAAWTKAIRDEGLSSKYVNGVLYVANTQGAAFGLPPAPAHLGLEKLELTLEDWEDVPFVPTCANKLKIAPENPSPNTTNATYVGTEEGTQAIALVQQFMDFPTQATHELLVTAAAVQNTFLIANKNPAYKMGTNKFAQTSVLRNKFLGEERKASFAAYAAEIRAVASPKTDMGFLVLAMRMKGLVRAHEDLMYISPQL